MVAIGIIVVMPPTSAGGVMTATGNRPDPGDKPLRRGYKWVLK